MNNNKHPLGDFSCYRTLIKIISYVLFYKCIYMTFKI